MGLDGLDRRIAVYLGLFAFCAFGLVAGGHFYSLDDLQKFQSLDAYVHTGSFAIPEGWVPGLGGKMYSWFPLGSSLLMLPGYVFAHLLAPVLPAGFAPAEVARVLISLQNAPLTALLMVAVFLAARGLDLPRRGALLAALALGFGTFAFTYAKTSWSEPGATLGLFVGLAATWHAVHRPERRAGALLLAGLGLGAAASIRQELAIQAILAFGYVLWHARRDRAALVQAGVWMLPPLVLSAAGTIWYEWARFGTFLHPPNFTLPTQRVKLVDRPAFAAVNLYRYLLSPNHGIVWFSPAVVAGAVGLPAFARRHPSVARLGALTILPLAAFYIVAWGPSSWAWGLRYTYMLLPFLVLPIAAIAWRGLAAGVAGAALGLGLVVQLVSLPFDVDYLYERDIARTPGATIRTIMDQPAHAPILLAVRDLPLVLEATPVAFRPQATGAPIAEGLRAARRAGIADMWWLLYRAAGLPPGPLTAVALALLLGAIAAAAALARAMRTA